jgi:aminoglycoside phosphotransferase (APT) family kinase protein
LGLHNSFAQWPEEVRAHVLGTWGEPSGVERLGGMSLARVYRLRVAGASFVVKTSPDPTEAAFYAHMAPALRGAGVPIPTLEWSCHLPGAHWLIIEDLPGMLPPPNRETWRPDPRITTILARLHRATRGWAEPLPPSRWPVWTDDLTDAALSCFPAPTRHELTPLVRALQHEAQRLSQPWCFISGDPSAPNWGLRANGSLVLFDWELCRPGIPAMDLGITVPGLGDRQQFEAAARAYHDVWAGWGEPLPWTRVELASDATLAKAETVFHLLSAHATNAARVPEQTIAWLVETVPGWLRGLGR